MKYRVYTNKENSHTFRLEYGLQYCISDAIILYLNCIVITERLRLWVRVSQNREPSPSEAIMDSQSVETATMGSKDVGYDSGKKIKGRKRHILVDTLGLLIVVVITAADVSEQAGAKQVLSKLHQLRDRMGRLIRIWVDGGYRGKDFTHWFMDVYRWLWSVVTRHEEQKGFVVLPKRWLVERTFGWFNWCRRLSKDYEILPETTEAFRGCSYDSFNVEAIGVIKITFSKLFRHPLKTSIIELF